MMRGSGMRVPERQMGKRASLPVTILVVVVVVLVSWANRGKNAGPGGAPKGAGGSGANGSGASDCAGVIKAALEAERSDVMVECSGEVIKVLEDDNDGARHQRFLVKLSNGVVVKVSHNIDLAPRVPAEKGDTLEFKGEFEWNDLGGAVHWTHHDPRGKREGGWLRLGGKVYE